MTSNLQEIVLTSSPDGPITGYDSLSGDIASEFTGSRSPRNGIALVGKNLIAVSHVSSDTGRGSINLYNWLFKTPFQNLAVPEPVAPLAVTRDGLYLFAGGLSGKIHSFSLPSGDLIHSFHAHKKAVSCLEISDDESLMFSGSDGGTIAVIPLFALVDASPSKMKRRDAIICRFEGHTGSITAIRCGFGGGNCCTIMSSSLDHTCKVWSLMYGTHTRSVEFPCPILSMAMDSIESEFYAVGVDGVIYKVAMKAPSRQAIPQARKIMALKQHHYGPIVSIRIMNEGKNFVTASEDGNVWLWDIQSEEVVRILGHELNSISSLVVAKVYNEAKAHSVLEGLIQREGTGYSAKELQKPMSEIMELKQQLNVAVQDRRRSMHNLESAFGIYERLLKIVLEFSKDGNNSDGTDDDDDDDDSDDDDDDDEQRFEVRPLRING